MAAGPVRLRPADAVVLALTTDATARRVPLPRRTHRRLATPRHGAAGRGDTPSSLGLEASGRVLRTRPACAATAAILARAGFRTAVDGAAFEWQDDPSWIALTNSGRTTTLSAEIGRLMRADHPDLALAVLGVIPLPHDASPQVFARVDELRRIIRRREERTLR